MVARSKTTNKCWNWMIVAFFAIVVAILVIFFATKSMKYESFESDASLFKFSETPLEPSVDFPVIAYQLANFTGYSVGFKYGVHQGAKLLPEINRRNIKLASTKMLPGFNMIVNNIKGTRKDADMKMNGAFPESILIHDEDNIKVMWNPIVIGLDVVKYGRDSNGNAMRVNASLPFGTTFNGKKYEDNLAEVIWSPEGFINNGCSVPGSRLVAVRKFLPNTTDAPLNAVLVFGADDAGWFYFEYMNNTISPVTPTPNAQVNQVARAFPITIPVGGVILVLLGKNQTRAGCAGIRGSVFTQDGLVMARTDLTWKYVQNPTPPVVLPT